MKYFKCVFLFACLFFGANQIKAQHNIEFVTEKGVEALVEKHKEFNEKANNIPGYRLNVFFASGNNSKSAAFEVKKRFEDKYPKVKAYIVFETPNFKVKAGDFRTRSEARGFQLKIRNDFPNAFVIKEDINPLYSKPIEEEKSSK